MSCAVRVIVRLPYNRPDDAPPAPPRIEWNTDKEHILWEVIAKSRAIEGAGCDWKGLADHLSVPLPYLLYRAQVRYEQDLRGLQGLGLRTPAPLAFPSAPSPVRTMPAESFPRVPDPAGQREINHLASSSSAAASATVPGSSTLRPAIGVRARLSSLGHAHGRPLAQLRSPIDHVQSPLSAHPTKKVSSSSVITLQGPNKPRSPLLHPLSPASSRAGSSSEGHPDSSSDDEDESDDEARKEDAEKQELLARKLQNLERLMTKDTLGLVAQPKMTPLGNPQPAASISRGRLRALSASLSVSTAPQTYAYVRAHSPSHQSLSSASVDSPQGSIPSIPSPTTHSQSPPQPSNRNVNANPYRGLYTHSRHRSHGNVAPSFSATHPTRSHSQSQSPSSESHSQPRSPARVSSPVPVSSQRYHRLGPGTTTPEKSSSPPALASGSARGQPARPVLCDHPAANAGGTPTTGSEASSFSDLSDASVSQSALESALMSNIRGGGSRLSSFARSHLPGGKRSARS